MENRGPKIDHCVRQADRDDAGVPLLGPGHGLLTEAAILAFIGAGGIEAPAYIHTKGWENNPDPKSIVYIDAYRFYSGSTCGYLALGLMPATGKWMIKSFKEDDERDPRAFLLAAKLRKAGY